MLTPSVFHFSVKLASCAAAAVVSAPEIVRIAVEPRFTPICFRPGTSTLFTDFAVVASPSTATFLPSRVCWRASSSSVIATHRS